MSSTPKLDRAKATAFTAAQALAVHYFALFEAVRESSPNSTNPHSHDLLQLVNQAHDDFVRRCLNPLNERNSHTL